MALLDEINQQLINKILRAQQKYKFFMLVLRIIMRLVGGRGGITPLLISRGVLSAEYVFNTVWFDDFDAQVK